MSDILLPRGWESKVVARPPYMTTRKHAESVISGFFGLFNSGLFGKWDFYKVCSVLAKKRWITQRRIAEITGIEQCVIQGRLRDCGY